MNPGFRYILFSLLLGIPLWTSQGCGTAKEAGWSDAHLHIHSAYVQKYVPGQQDERIVSYLIVDVELRDPNVKLEKVYYQGHLVPVSAVKFPLKIDWASGALEQKEQIEDNQAIIYYAVGEKHFKQRIEDVQKKEDLYLP
jgi:hypothetical protein